MKLKDKLTEIIDKRIDIVYNGTIVWISKPPIVGKCLKIVEVGDDCIVLNEGTTIAIKAIERIDGDI